MHASTLIRMARKDAGLTLRELATVAATSHSTLAMYESGAKTPGVATLSRVLDAAGFAVDVELHRRQRGTPTATRGDELLAVLELAEVFPASHATHLEAPIFPHLV